MAEGVSDAIEEALQTIVSTAEQSGKLRKELKHKIFDTVSTLRNHIVKLFETIDSNIAEKTTLAKQVVDLEAKLVQTREMKAKELGKPSSAENNGLAAKFTRKGAPSDGCASKESEPLGNNGEKDATQGGSKLYSEVAGGRTSKQLYQLIVKSKGNNMQEGGVKGILTTKIIPFELKVGINKFKLLNNGGVIIGTNTEQELEVLGKEIELKCGEELQANVLKMRKPRLVIHNIPEDTSITNLEETIMTQNPDIGLKKGDIETKFIYTTKNKGRNIVLEVEPQVRKLLIQAKIKMGWQICRAVDYVVVTRCFKCSRFNHRHRECKGDETCPLCAGPHRLKDCKADPRSYKCVNCTTYNKHNPTKNICSNHSSLDRKCPSMQAILERYRRNTEY